MKKERKERKGRWMEQNNELPRNNGRTKEVKKEGGREGRKIMIIKGSITFHAVAAGLDRQLYCDVTRPAGCIGACAWGSFLSESPDTRTVS